MKRIHFIGIGGSGLSAIARLLKESGYEVTGSDRALSQFAVDLQNEGISIYIGHHPRNVGGADLVIRSSAIADNNPEVEAAKLMEHRQRIVENAKCRSLADFQALAKKRGWRPGWAWNRWKISRWNTRAKDGVGVETNETVGLL